MSILFADVCQNIDPAKYKRVMMFMATRKIGDLADFPLVVNADYLEYQGIINNGILPLLSASAQAKMRADIWQRYGSIVAVMHFASFNRSTLPDISSEGSVRSYLMEHQKDFNQDLGDHSLSYHGAWVQVGKLMIAEWDLGSLFPWYPMFKVFLPMAMFDTAIGGILHGVVWKAIRRAYED